jgi:putative ABC transport system permease protein
MGTRAVSLYRQVLRLFPRAFRARFGDDMALMFADRLRAARRQGRLAVAALWWRTTVDVLEHASAERRQAPLGHQSRGGFMRTLLDDLATAIRSHVRRPGLILLAAPMLAIGLGFNTALFAVVHAVVLRPLPYLGPDRVVMVWTGRNPDGSGSVNSYADYAEWKTRSHSFESLATYNISFATLADGGDPEEVGGSVVSPEFFHVLGGRILLGRGIAPGDELIGIDSGRPIVLAESLWTRRFNRDPHILERTMTLAGHQRRIVGIVSPEFVHPEPFWGERTEYWSPLTVTADMRTNHANHFLRVIGRLAPGVTLAQARADMDGIGRDMMNARPVTNTSSVVLAPVANELQRGTRTMAWVFLAAAALVLVLGIANIVNLLLARANQRRGELTVRIALGASNARLVRQLVLESTVVGLAGGLLGLGLAEVGIRVLLAYAPINSPGIDTTTVDLAAAGFAVALSTLTGATCGLLPAWRVARARLGSTVGQRGSSGLETSRARRWLVSAEMALALPLVVGAGLLARTLVGMEQVNPGFDASHALEFRVTTSGPRYDSDAANIAFFTDLVERLRAAPGVTAAGIVTSLPLGGLNNTGGQIVYQSADGVPAELGVGFRAATAGYFAALHIPLRQGRLFDATAADKATVVINDRAAAAMWGEADPIGRRLRFGSLADRSDAQDWLTVIGVVGSLRHEALTRLPNPEVFRPYQAMPWSTMTVVTRTTGEPAAIGSSVRAAVRAVDPHLAIVNMAPMTDFLGGQLAAPRFGVVASTIFGVLGLALAAFGLFAVLSLSVAQRTREIGIRLALGATRRAVGRLLARESIGMVAVGCVLGCLASALLSQVIASELFGVTPHDEVAFAESVGVLLVSAIAAGWWPARRAMQVNPVTALRAD